MWARDASASFLRTPDEMRAVVEAAGFRVERWDDVSSEVAGPSVSAPAHSIQRIVMGDALEAIARSGERNREQKRIVMVQAVLRRRES
jgi:hypothetical protein